MNPTTVLDYLENLRPALPYSIEKPCEVPSKSEVRRWCNNKAVVINGINVGSTDFMPDEEVFQLIFFPKSKKRKTTLV